MSSEVAPDARVCMDILLERQKILARVAPEWYGEFEDVDPFIADRSVVDNLLLRAPNDFAIGLLCGILMFRQQLAAMTGREF